MRSLVKIVGLSPLAIWLFAVATIAQEPREIDTRIDLIQQVMGHRIAWQRDSTLFDACVLSQVIGTGETDLSESLAPWGSVLLDRTDDPCADQGGGRLEGGGRVVVQSIDAFADSALVVVRVVRRDRAHFESFRFRRTGRSGTYRIHNMMMDRYLEYTPTRGTPDLPNTGD